jgi:hypothetical protein
MLWSSTTVKIRLIELSGKVRLGLVIPKLVNYNSEKSLSLQDIEALSVGQSLESYDAMVIYDSHDSMDRAFR